MSMTLLFSSLSNCRKLFLVACVLCLDSSWLKVVQGLLLRMLIIAGAPNL